MPESVPQTVCLLYIRSGLWRLGWLRLGIYRHCGKKHLHRYMAEFDFRYSNRAALDVTDTMRADIALNQIVGKRLLYRDSLGA